MSLYEDTPNPFANDPSPPASINGDERSAFPSRSITPSPPTGASTSNQYDSEVSDKPLPPDPYPNFNLYPSNDDPSGDKKHGSDPVSAYHSTPTKSTAYPDVNPYPSTPSHQHQASRDSNISKASTASPPPTYRPTFPVSGVGQQSYVGPKVKEEACCTLDEELQNGTEISIIDAVKTNDGGRASYITYVIKTGNRETHHRYSHFDSLRSSLQSLYPVLIVPPIPSKQSLTDYAVKGSSKAKEDATVIARRMRTLEDFLRRLGRHPILGGEHVLHRFLDGVSSWNDVLHSPPLSLLPKNPLHAPTYNPTIRPAQPFPASPETPSQNMDPEDAPPSAAPEQAGNSPSTPGGSYIAHHLLPNVSAATPLKHPDGRFMDSEAFTDKFAHHLSSVMERVNRRTVKRWGERAQGSSELGAVINGLSLDLDPGNLGNGLGVEEDGMRGVQEAVEKFGQAVDAEHMSTALLLQQWERSTTEPLHTYSQYGSIIRQRLAFRHQKHVQYELVQSTLDSQREKLEGYEKAEKESRRLEEALESGGKNLTASTSNLNPPAQGQSVLTGQSMIGGSVYRESGAEEGSATPRTVGRKKAGGGGYGLLSAVKHSLSGMMDVDPEATRRANIGKTRDNISQLEESLQAAAQDLKYASQTLQADLDRFQRQKVADMRDMTIALAEVHRDWAKANLKAWEEAKLAINGIEKHPNQPPAQIGSSPTKSNFHPQQPGTGHNDTMSAQPSFSIDRSKTEVGPPPRMENGFEPSPATSQRESGPVKDHPL